MMGRRQFLATGIGALSAARVIAFDRSTRVLATPSHDTNPLVRSSGLYANFGPAEGWVQVTPDAAIDSSSFGPGLNTLRLTSTNGQKARAQCVLGPPPAKMLQLDVYVEDPAACTRFEVAFSSNGFQGWIAIRTVNPQFVTGWNRLQFSVNDCTVEGTGMTAADWDNVTLVEFGLFSQPATTARVWVSRFRWLLTKPAVTFTWDDGRAGCYTNAMPILKQYGWASTIYVVTAAVDQNSFTLDGGGSLPDPVTLDQLRGLQDAGWDISSHSVTHPDLSSLSDDQQQYQLESAKEWLLTNGFTNGARFFATPYGKRNASTQTIASTLYDNLRDGSSSPDPGYETPLNLNFDLNTRYQLRYQELNSLSRTPLSEFQSWIDATIDAGAWLIVLGHNVDGPNGWLDPTLFQQYVDYVASRKDQIDVMTMSEYWDRRNQSLAEFSRTIGRVHPL